MDSPRKRRKVVADDGVFLDALPCAKMYEKSFMHRDVLTHVLASKKGFVITCSADGIVKFWKRMDDGALEFVKAFRAHAGPIDSAALSPDGAHLATACRTEPTIKVFDVAAFDMVSMVKVKEGVTPGRLCWLKGTSLLLAVLDSDEVVRWSALDKAPKSLKLDAAASALAYSPLDDTLIAGHADGTLGLYAVADDLKRRAFEGPTHLGDAKGATIDAVKLSDDGRFFLVVASDRQVRIFRTATGKLYRKYDESLAVYTQLQTSGKPPVVLDDAVFGQRLATERELEKSGTQPFDAVFDESGSFLLYTSLVGVKVLSLATNKVTGYLGSGETPRFSRLALLQHDVASAGGEGLELAASENVAGTRKTTPLLVAAALKHSRFYVFSRSEPDKTRLADRDVLNEKPVKPETKPSAKILPTQAVIRTTVGDIVVKLLPDAAPLAVENFCTHSRNGYFDSLLFHRVIKGFMVQTGDPLGDGTGGESIWGADFRDETRPDVLHDQPFTVSMANAGPGTNGSQFFITTAKCPWLDGKHTIFGRVVRGSDVVGRIEGAETDELDKPKTDIKILQVDIQS